MIWVAGADGSRRSVARRIATNPPDQKSVGALESALAHWGEVFGLLLQLTADRGLAEDLTQDVFLRLATLKRPVDDRGSLRPLLFTIARNLARNARRRRPSEALEAALVVAPASDPAASLEAKDQKRVVEEALAPLDPTWRAVLFLRDGLGLTYAEIAEALDLGVDVVRVTLHRARMRVRETVMRRLNREEHV